MVTEFSYKQSYELFLAQQEYNQNAVLQYSNECVHLEAGNIRGLVAVNEGVIGGIKSIINKILETIGNLWRKFAERMTAWFMSKQTYLKKYETIITNNTKYPVKEREITIFNYNLAKIKDGFAVPALNSADIAEGSKFMKLAEGSDDERTKEFIDGYLNGQGITVDTNKTLQEMIELVLRGGDEEQPVKTNSMPISIKTMYDWVKAFPATKESYNKDAVQIDKNKAAFETALGKAESELNKAVDPQADVQKDTTQDSAEENKEVPKVAAVKGTTEAEGYTQASAIWSSVKGTYISELSGVTAKAGDTKGSLNNTRVGDQGVNKDTKDTLQTNVQNTASSNGTKTKEDVTKNLENIKTASTTFFKCCGDIVSAKLTVSSQMYKEFFILIKMHVRDYIKNADADDVTPVDKNKEKK